jgi:hypothetical protein
LRLVQADDARTAGERSTESAAAQQRYGIEHVRESNTPVAQGQYQAIELGIKNTKDAILAARNSNLLARAVRRYYLQNGLTPDLCHDIELQPDVKLFCDRAATMPVD